MSEIEPKQEKSFKELHPVAKVFALAIVFALGGLAVAVLGLIVKVVRWAWS